MEVSPDGDQLFPELDGCRPQVHQHGSLGATARYLHPHVPSLRPDMVEPRAAALATTGGNPAFGQSPGALPYGDGSGPRRRHPNAASIARRTGVSIEGGAISTYHRASTSSPADSDRR